MVVIEATNAKGWRWLAGVFAEQDAAAAFLSAVPEQERHSQKTVVLPDLRYPFFVIETRGFEYGDLAFVKSRLSQHEYPRVIVFARKLPMTPTGKVRRVELRAPDADERFGLG